MAVSRHITTWNRSMEGFRELGSASQRKIRKRACVPIAEQRPSPHRSVLLGSRAVPPGSAPSDLPSSVSAAEDGEAVWSDQPTVVQTVTSGISLVDEYETAPPTKGSDEAGRGGSGPSAASFAAHAAAPFAPEGESVACVSLATGWPCDSSAELQKQLGKLPSASGGVPLLQATERPMSRTFASAGAAYRSSSVGASTPSAAARVRWHHAVIHGSRASASGICRTFVDQQGVGFSRVTARRHRLVWLSPGRKATSAAAAASNRGPAQSVRRCRASAAAAAAAAQQQQPPPAVWQQCSRSGKPVSDSLPRVLTDCSSPHAECRPVSVCDRGSSACGHQAGAGAGWAPSDAPLVGSAGLLSEPDRAARCGSGALSPADGAAFHQNAFHQTAAADSFRCSASATPRVEVMQALDAVTQVAVADEHAASAAASVAAPFACDCSEAEPAIVTQWSCAPSTTWGTIECATPATGSLSDQAEHASTPSRLAATEVAVISEAYTQGDRAAADTAARSRGRYAADQRHQGPDLNDDAQRGSPPWFSSASSGDLDRSLPPGTSSEDAEPPDLEASVQDGGCPWPAGAPVARAAQHRQQHARCRTVRGGLARRLLRLVARQASARALCEHDFGSGAAGSAACRQGALVCVLRADAVGSVPSVVCEVLEDDTNAIGTGSRVTVVLHDFAVGGGGHLAAGAVVELASPWTVLANGGATLLLSSSYYRVRDRPDTDSRPDADVFSRTGDAVPGFRSSPPDLSLRLLQVVRCACVDPAAGICPTASCDATVEYRGLFASL